MATRTPSAPHTAGKLAAVTLPDDRGDQVRLGSLWEEGPAVIVWLRHYG
jgi:hypothetical protein